MPTVTALALRGTVVELDGATAMRAATQVLRRPDGAVYAFGGASEALDAAIAAQRDATGMGIAPPSIGIDLGDVREIDGQFDTQAAVFAVANGLAESTEPATILVSHIVRLVAAARLDLVFDPPPGAEADDAWRLVWTRGQPDPAPRVIVAEDVPLLRAGIVALLREEGFDVVGDVGDADALVDAARRARPDLVITDVRMPTREVGDGIDAATLLRSEQPDLAVLVLSQHIELRAAAALIEHHDGAIGYVLKERVSHLDDFIAACREVVSGGVVVDPLVTERLMRPGGPNDPLTRLTEREREVLELMAQGRSNVAIAGALSCSPKTLETHIRSIFLKLDLAEDRLDHRRVSAVVRYLESRH